MKQTMNSLKTTKQIQIYTILLLQQFTIPFAHDEDMYREIERRYDNRSGKGKGMQDEN